MPIEIVDPTEYTILLYNHIYILHSYILHSYVLYIYLFCLIFCIPAKSTWLTYPESWVDMTVLLKLPMMSSLHVTLAKEADRKASAKITKTILNKLNKFKDVFSGIGCFESRFSLQFKEESKPYQAASISVAYTLQQPFKDELEHLQKLNVFECKSIATTSYWSPHKWKWMIMSRASKVKSSKNMTNTQRAYCK